MKTNSVSDAKKGISTSNDGARLGAQECSPELGFFSQGNLMTMAVVIGVVAFLWVVGGHERIVFDARVNESHPIYRWMNDCETNKSHFIVADHDDIELHTGFTHSWRGNLVAGSMHWPGGNWSAQFSVLPSLVTHQEAQAMKVVLENALDEFDEDRDGVDEMITYEFIIMSAGAMKSRDAPREHLRKKLLDITMPIIRERIAPFVRKRYPEAREVCHSMIRRYLHHERRTHNTHWDVPSFVSVVVSLDSSGVEFDGGFFVTTGTGLQSFIPLQQGDTVVHQGDLLHGVHVQRGDRWSWAMWFQDSANCASDPADWWKDEAESGNAVAQTLRAMRARNGAEARRWVHLAALSGFPRSLVYFGRAHHEGWNGEEKDLAQAVYWYQKAREAGNADASFFLGTVERDLGNTSRAIQHFRDGAERGDTKAMGELAAVYQNGLFGMPLDLDLALYWYEKAADFLVEAMYQSYVLYSQATLGRPTNVSLAQLYLERAARMGHFMAMERFVKLLLQNKRLEEAVPFLLRMESKPSMEMFIKLFQSGVKMKPFVVLRATQVLQPMAEHDYEGAKELLSVLQAGRSSL